MMFTRKNVLTSIDTPEYQLVLHKISCSVDEGVTLQGNIDVSDEEKELIDGILVSRVAPVF